MSRPLMKCGHIALGVETATGKAICPICVGIDPGAEVVDEAPLDLSGRTAVCAYCKTEVPSDYSLPFFELGHLEKIPGHEWKSQRVTAPPDGYYCGCRGWD